MTEKLSVQLDIAANALAEFKASEMANVCRQAQAIVKAWEDAPEFIARGNCMSIPRMGISPSAAAIRDELPIGWIGKRVKIVEVKDGRG
jgi:hypothetical protein